MPLSPPGSHSHLSPKTNTLSTSPNFNPFAPLSPYQPNRKLQDPDGDASIADPSLANLGRVKRVYSRDTLLAIAKGRPLSTWPRPKDMAQLQDWFGISSSKGAHHDPAIVSIGNGPGRKTGGFGEGFGFGGGIGGKGLGKGARQHGHGHSDHRSRKQDIDSNGLPVPPRDSHSGPMGKFSVKGTAEKPRTGMTDDGREARDDWRKATGSNSHSRQENRQWIQHQNTDDTRPPAWMDDQGLVDPAIAMQEVSTPFSFGGGIDPIAAHKRMMRGESSANDGDQGRKSVFSQATQSAAADKPAKAAKPFNATDYLRPTKAQSKAGTSAASATAQAEEASQSRSRNWFKASQAESPATPQQSTGRSTTLARDDYVDPIKSPLASADGTSTGYMPAPAFVNTLPLTESPMPPQQDHASRLMGLLTNKVSIGGRAHEESHQLRGQSSQSIPQQGSFQPQHQTTSPPPGLQYNRSAFRNPNGPTPPASSHIRPMDYRASDRMQSPQPQLSNPSISPHYMMGYPDHHQHHHQHPYQLPPGLLPTSSQQPNHAFQHGQTSGLHHASLQNMPPHPTGYAYPPIHSIGSIYNDAIPPPHTSTHHLPTPQQNMLATLYGNQFTQNRH